MIVIPGDLDYRYDGRVEPDFLGLFDARGAVAAVAVYGNVIVTAAGTDIAIHELTFP